MPRLMRWPCLFTACCSACLHVCSPQHQPACNPRFHSDRHLAVWRDHPTSCVQALRLAGADDVGQLKHPRGARADAAKLGCGALHTCLNNEWLSMPCTLCCAAPAALCRWVPTWPGWCAPS